MTRRTRRMLSVGVDDQPLSQLADLDFAGLRNLDVQRRVRGLRAAGWAEENIAIVCGWSVDLVRRALQRGGSGGGDV